jgi:hypothetical protein
MSRPTFEPSTSPKAQLDGAWLGSFYVITVVIAKESYSNAPCIRPGAARLVIGRARLVGSPQKRVFYDPQRDSARAVVEAIRGLQSKRQASLVQVCIHLGLVFIFCCRGARRVKFSVTQLALAKMYWSNDDIFNFIELYKSQENNTITRRVIPQAEPNLPEQGRWSAICRAAPSRVARMSFLFRSVGRTSDVTSLDEPRAV